MEPQQLPFSVGSTQAKLYGLHPAATQLACHIVREQLGELCERVLRCVVQRGPATLTDLQRFLGDPANILRFSGRTSMNATLVPIKAKDVRSALLVLVQHHCAFARLPLTDNSFPLPQPVFRADLQGVLHRLGHPHTSLYVQNKYESVIKTTTVECLLENGQLRLDQILAAVRETLAGTDNTASSQEIEEAVLQLIDGHLLERSPPWDLPELKSVVHPNAQPRKARAAPKKNSPEEAFAEAERGRALTVRSYWDNRYDPPVSVPANGTSIRTPPGDSKVKSDPNLLVGAKRKREDVAAAETSADEAMQLWQVSQTEVARRLRHDACVRYMGEHYGEAAEAVVRGLLAAAPPWTNEAGAESASTPVSQAQVVTAVRRHPGGAGLADIAIRKTLGKLRDTAEGCVLATRDGNFYVSLERIVDNMKQEELEAHLRERFGTSGLRIWRMLHMRGQLEEHTIVDTSLMPPKEARSMLYMLLESGFVTMQDIPRGADRAASRMFWTWRAHAADSMRVLSQHMVKGMLNLRLRLEHEHFQVQDATKAYAEGKHLPTSQLDALQRLRDLQTIFEGRMMRLQPLLGLFHDY